MMDQIGGVKFLTTILITILASILLYTGKLNQDLYVQLIEWIETLFVTGNVLPTVSAIFKGNSSQPDSNTGALTTATDTTVITTSKTKTIPPKELPI